MTCDEALRQIPALVMDELDVEVRRDVEAHLAACGACREERERQGHAVAALRALRDVETSASRRESAVSGMAGARDELVERAMMRRPVRWSLRLTAAAAAALVVAAIAWATLLPSTAWRVTEARGTAVLVGSGRLKAGGFVRAGELVQLLEDATVTLESDDGRVRLSGGSQIEILGRNRIRLISGSVRVETRGELTVRSAWNDAFTLRAGAAVVASDLRAVSPATRGPDGQVVQPARVEGSRLKVTIEGGEGVLRGSGGELQLMKGERARIDERNRPTNEEEPK